ncbi:MAG TPA: DUF4867 domain-containing protein [Sphaerochaeta sp.]|nr:DUF4867 domain-containing protein [Sphaerochaeta sp.]
MQEINYRVPSDLIAKNSTSMILSVQSSRFEQYGQIIDCLDVQDLLDKAAEITPIPEEGNLYIPSLKELEVFNAVEALAPYFEHQPIQVGFCNGKNQSMNGLEYHKSAEIIMAVTECVLFLCPFDHLQDFETVRTADAELFYLPKGAVVLIKANVLHLAPCMVDQSGFKTIILLPRDTNEPLDPEEIEKRDSSLKKEDRLLFKKNKWLLAHPERVQMVSQNVHVGLVGENRMVHPL